MIAVPLPFEDRHAILELIYQQQTHREKLRPTAITLAQEVRFFDLYNNHFEGWFCDVRYADGLYEIWFVVDLRGDYVDDDWHIEKVR